MEAYAETLDFDAEAHALFKSLNLSPVASTGGSFNSLDPIYRHPTTNATIYVGNQSAAESIELMKKMQISCVVNCTDNMANFHEKRGSPGKKRGGSSEDASASSMASSKTSTASSKKPSSPEHQISYLRFPISFWSRQVKDTDQSVLDFLSPLFTFVDAALKSGRSILVHCLAGAHRAGTTGVLLLMRYSGMNDVEQAIFAAKKLRRIIDPIGMLPELLKRYSQARERGVEGEIDV